MAFTVQTRSPKFYLAIQTQDTVYTSDPSSLGSPTLRDSVYEIVTSRRIGETAGSFQITLSPRIKDDVHTLNWLDLLHPMDYVEIAIDSGVDVPIIPSVGGGEDSDHPIVGRGKRPAPVMRGFIDSVVEQGSFESGIPGRSIVVTGRDFGKIALFTMMYNYTDSKLPPVIQLLQSYTDGRATVSNQNLKPNPSLGTAAEKLTNDSGRNPTNMMSLFYTFFFEPHMNEITKHLVPTFGSRARIGTIEFFLDSYNDKLFCFDPILENSNLDPFSQVWSCFERYQNKPWAELYFDDDDDGPRFIHRTTPWYDVNGKEIQGNPYYSATITDQRVLSYGYGRSDAEVFNLFSTESLLWGPLIKARINMGQISKEPNSNPRIISDNDTTPSNIFRFGLRQLEMNSPYLSLKAGVSQDDYDAAMRTGPGAELNDKLFRAYSFNEQLLAGQISIKGDTHIHIGDYIYLRLVRRPLQRFYVESVSHAFRQPTGIEGGEGSFRTTLVLTRGQQV